ncbi:MAG: dihydroorotase, partial [Acidobacteriota bacterium]
LDRLETFASLNGPRFYGLPTNEEKIALVRRSWRVLERVGEGGAILKPFLAGEEIGWMLDPS